MPRRRWLWAGLALLSLTLALVPGRPARADSAPLMPVVPGLQPTQSTTVRMESEQIDLHVSQAPGSHFGLSLVEDVRVQFHFVPTADEQMTAGFPLQSSTPQGMQGLTVEEFSVTADGKALAFQTKGVTWQGETADWAVWQLAFTKGQPLDLTVRYRLPFGLLGKGPGSGIGLFYLLRTGSYWAGTIGRADAVVSFDVPIEEGDILAGATSTPGYTLRDGKLFWSWHDIEPDFDLDLRMNNPYWRTGPAELHQLLQKPSLSRDETLQAVQMASLLLAGDPRSGEWIPMPDGRLSAEVVAPELPRVTAAVEAAIAAHPQETELQASYIGMWLGATWHLGSQGRQFLGVDRLQHFYAAVARYRESGGDFLGPSPDRREQNQALTFWAEAAADAYQHSTDSSLRKTAVAQLVRLMPAHFPSADQARSWVTFALTKPPQELTDDLVAVALARVEAPLPKGPGLQTGAESAPAPVAAPTAVAPAAPSGTLIDEVLPATPARKRGGIWWLWLGGGLALVAVVWAWKRR